MVVGKSIATSWEAQKTPVIGPASDSCKFLQYTNQHIFFFGFLVTKCVMVLHHALCSIVLRGRSLKTKPPNRSPRFRDVVCNLMKVKTVSQLRCFPLTLRSMIIEVFPEVSLAVDVDFLRLERVEWCELQNFHWRHIQPVQRSFSFWVILTELSSSQFLVSATKEDISQQQLDRYWIEASRKKNESLGTKRVSED